MTGRWTPPKHIDELRVERLLGRGAMAGVWLARDATGVTDGLPTGGRAQLVLDMSGSERSSESGMQHR